MQLAEILIANLSLNEENEEKRKFEDFEAMLPYWSGIPDQLSFIGNPEFYEEFHVKLESGSFGRKFWAWV